MKSLFVLAILALMMAPLNRAEAQSGSINRDGAFAQIQTNAGSMLNGLFSGDFGKDEFAQTLSGLTEDLYRSGFISLAQLNGKLGEINSCIAAQTAFQSNGSIGNFADRNNKCTAAINYQGLKASKPACVQANQVLSGAECCANLVTMVSATLEASTAGKKSNESCSGHADCASKLCVKDEGASAGICAPVLTCKPVIPVNGECGPENPNCAPGSVCRPQDVGLGGVTCKPLAAACGGNTECCSTKCNANKCVEKYICEACMIEGQKPTGQLQCCRGLIKDLDGICILEMPPFILPSASSAIRDFWKTIVRNINPLPAAQAMVPVEMEQVDGGSSGSGGSSGTGGTSGSGTTGGTSGTGTTGGTTGSTTGITSTNESGSTSQGTGTFGSDDALTIAQLEMIEGEISKILDIKDRNVRKQKLLAVYELRKKMAADNAAAAKAGQPVGKTFTQDEYVKRYNIPAITPKGRSNVETCEFNTVKDNWIDSSNLMRNADLFVRSFEVSFSGKGTKDTWHLLDANGKPHEKNLFSRGKYIANEVRDNRNYQRDQLKYLDMIMSCQCIYAFGPEKFSADKQTFFYSKCTGNPTNKICTDGDRRNQLKLPDSTEPEFKNGDEFPNYVAMYLAKLNKMQGQGGKVDGDVTNLDSSAAGINHEEVLVRWLKLRSCNQTDVFIDVEKVETEVQSLVEDLNRAKKVNPTLKAYWDARLNQMASNDVPDDIINFFRNDQEKDTWFRGYVATESKVHSWTKKVMGWLLALLIIILVVCTFGIGLAGIALAVSATLLAGAIGLAIFGQGGSSPSGVQVIQKFSKYFPDVKIEDRLVESKTCGFLGLFKCTTWYRILHWPAYSNNPGIQQMFPWVKREERTCAQTFQATSSYPGVAANPCSGPFKGTMCARSFFYAKPDAAIANKAEFASWKPLMADNMLMDPVFPEFYGEQVNLDNGWIPALKQGFISTGCPWVSSIGKAQAKAEDKVKFFPDFKKYLATNGEFLPEYQFTQERIDKYKAAIKKYALCKSLIECGATNYDGKHPDPWGFGDVFETAETAEMYANYVYQLHYNWRHLSSQAIGYPLKYAENYYMTLLHNFRLLTTLSIRRGLELDDAYNKYADDLAIRRSNYQLNGNQYDLKTGKDSRKKVVRSQLYGSLRGLGFPLSAEFSGLPSGGGLTGGGTADQGSASNASLGPIELNALNAAKRHATRVAKDNKAWKNYQDQTKGKADSAQRLASASNFFNKLNSPISAVPGMARPGDTSSYSGIGGKLSGGLGAAASSSQASKNRDEDDEKSKYGPVGDKNSAGADGGGAGANGAGANGLGANGNGADTGEDILNSLGADGAGANGAAADGQGNALGDAAKITGMKEGDLQNMLDANDKNKKGLESGDQDSLFQKVSKAYLRNLDRVLVRKKSADPKPVKKEAVDSEKEKINKIFAQ